MRIQDIKAVHPRLFKNIFVKDWYKRNYPDDELGDKINPFIKFYDLRIVIDEHYDIYYHLGVADTLIRQRIFAELANLLGVRYEVVYYAWLD